MNEIQWYALQTMPRHEDMVASLLRYKGYEEYVPEYQSACVRRKRPNPAQKLFPGYIFCRFAYGSSSYLGPGMSVVNTPGVVRIVGGRPPAAVPEHELDAIRQVLAASLKTKPCPYVRIGQKVKIEAGPLRGLCGVITSIDHGDWLVLSVELLRRSVAVKISAEWLGVGETLGEAIESAKLEASNLHEQGTGNRPEKESDSQCIPS